MDAHQFGPAEQPRTFYPTAYYSTAYYSTYSHAAALSIGIDRLEFAQ